jgi:FkbH-like protein
MHHNIESLSTQIHSSLQKVASGTHSLEQTLLALAQLGADEAIALCLSNKEGMRQSFDEKALSLVVDSVLTDALAQNAGKTPVEISTFAWEFRDIVSADVAVTVLAAIPVNQRPPLIFEIVESLLKRYPQHGPLIRFSIDIAISCNRLSDAQALMTRLTQADDSLATVSTVYKLRQKFPPPQQVSLRVALLSSFTIDPLVPYADTEFRALGLDPKFYVAPFNSWVQELISDGSGLNRFDSEIAFLAVSIDDFISELAGTFSRSDIGEKGESLVTQIVQAVRQFKSFSKVPVVVHSLYSVYRSLLGTHDSLGSWISNLNLRLRSELKDLTHVYVLDMQELLIHRNGGQFDNAKLRFLAQMRIGDRVLGEVARAYARYVAPLKGLRRKCVVLDLDNTLWGGIVGEDGPQRIKLGNTSPGVEYQEFQRFLLSLTEQGVLLAINSKNNLADAFEVIRSHEGMILREKDFSCVRINWDPKPENMVQIARELNIGLDSLIFVDDNPNEREIMRKVLPDVLTIALPTDPSLYRQALASIPQLQTLSVTEEDRLRVEQYRVAQQREQARGSTSSVEEYLSSLEIVVQILSVTDAMLPRVHQLFQRTNQFNLTSRRYSEAQLTEFSKDSNMRLYALRAHDRFGDHGLVAAALTSLLSEKWVLDSFLMSCRVIGYGVETAFLAVLCEKARTAGASVLLGECIETAKNAPARDFYLRHGFMPDGESAGVLSWSLLLDQSNITSPPWIKQVEVGECSPKK